MFIRGVLDKISDPIKRARKTHQYVESYTNEILKTDAAKEHITCHKGCDACCHTQVSVSSDEAKLLALKVDQGIVDIDLNRLSLQESVKNNSGDWFDLPYSARRCVFLNDEGACQVYEDRPSVCRTNNVFSSPKLCETKDGVEQSIRLLNTEKADLAMIAGYQAAGEGGTLPHLLSKYLGATSRVLLRQAVRQEISTERLNKVKKDLSKILEL